MKTVGKGKSEMYKAPLLGACKVKLVFKLKRRKDHLSTNGQVRAISPKTLYCKK